MALVEVLNVVKSFGQVEVLQGVSLEVASGDIVGLVGPSGCGKTTLVDIILGNILPDKGTVHLDGEIAPYSHVRPHLGYMPQAIALYEDITAQENLLFFSALYDIPRDQVKQRIERVLRLAWLSDQGKKLVHEFSGGMKRRLSLAIALLCGPKILIMDEPTVGLDPVHRELLWQNFRSLAEEGVAVLVTTHVMDEAMRCDKIAMMREGSLIACAPPHELTESFAVSSLDEVFLSLAKREGEVNHDD